MKKIGEKDFIKITGKDFEYIINKHEIESVSKNKHGIQIITKTLTQYEIETTSDDNLSEYTVDENEIDDVYKNIVDQLYGNIIEVDTDK